MQIKIIYPDIHNQHIKMIKDIQKPFLGKQDTLSKVIDNL